VVFFDGEFFQHVCHEAGFRGGAGRDAVGIDPGDERFVLVDLVEPTRGFGCHRRDTPDGGSCAVRCRTGARIRAWAHRQTPTTTAVNELRRRISTGRPIAAQACGLLQPCPLAMRIYFAIGLRASVNGARCAGGTSPAQANSWLRSAVVKALQAGRGRASTLPVGFLESRSATTGPVTATSTQLALLRLVLRQRAPLRSSAGIPGSSPVFVRPCVARRLSGARWRSG
jgi:hypothetical protein